MLIWKKFEHFDYEHWFKVYSVLYDENKLLSTRNDSADHPLLNQFIQNKTTGRIYQVVKVKKTWYRGWFYSALIESDGSHRMVDIENISCHDKSSLASIKSFQDTFIIVQK